MSEPRQIDVCFSLARADNGAFGHHGKLPWHLPNDLKRFKQLSMGKPLVMGRATFARDLASKPLPGRTNIVCTRDSGFAAQGIVIAHSVAEALRMAERDAREKDVDEIHVIGGAEIFRAALPYARRIYLTEVHASPAADTFFEAFDRVLWRETFSERHEADARHAYAYTFRVLERRGPALPIG